MLPRVLEPEVMDSKPAAEAYDQMDHSAVNRRFVADLLAELERTNTTSKVQTVLDVGTGNGAIVVELLRQSPQLKVTAIDLALSMLEIAQRHVQLAGFAPQVDFLCIDAKAIPTHLLPFDLVMSNSIVHHIPEPQTVLHEMWQAVRPGGLLFVRDLFRPDDQPELDRLVALYAGSEPPDAQLMFRESLHAALTLAEVTHLCAQEQIPTTHLALSSDRHWTLVAVKP
jgi:ubiquinone/menaquinone biosynthesis C-methylase UbiE